MFSCIKAWRCNNILATVLPANEYNSTQHKIRLEHVHVFYRWQKREDLISDFEKIADLRENKIIKSKEHLVKFYGKY